MWESSRGGMRSWRLGRVTLHVNQLTLRGKLSLSLWGPGFDRGAYVPPSLSNIHEEGAASLVYQSGRASKLQQSVPR